MATLGELVDQLSDFHPDHLFSWGIHNPHSYRGYYYRVAFERKGPQTAAEMLGVVQTTIGRTFTGYKGGEFTMDTSTPVHLASYGSCGPSIEGIGIILGEDD